MLLRAIPIAAALAAGAVLPGCGGGDKPESELPAAPESMRVTSPAFAAGDTIPERYTCDGQGVSPPLAWSGVPPKARELELVVEDPDAGNFVHWTVLGIPPTRMRLAEGRTPTGAVETENSFGDRGWGAPCPPKGDEPHRYEFALYASDAALKLDADSSPDQVHDQLAEHGIARGVISASFGR